MLKRIKIFFDQHLLPGAAVDDQDSEHVLRLAIGALLLEMTHMDDEVSEATVSRYMPQLPSDPNQLKRWMVFLRNHKDVIAAMDLFTVPTASLKVLYGFFVIDHSRQRILHFNATFNPTSAWVIQQLREAFPFDTAPKYLIFDRDAIFSAKMVGFVKAMGIKPCRTAYRSPWQKGYVSHCTSFVGFGATSGKRLRLEIFRPCCLTGGLLPGCSYKHSFLSL